MKKTVRVITEKEFDIDIPDHLLTAEYIKEFEQYIGEMDDSDKQRGLFKYAAFHAAKGYDHAEGLGYIGSEYMKNYQISPDDFIVVDEIYDESEEEIVE